MYTLYTIYHIKTTKYSKTVHDTDHIQVLIIKNMKNTKRAVHSFVTLV